MIIKENQSILIPVDFSKQSLIAIKQSYNLARFTRSRIILMQVVPEGEADRKDELEKLAATTRDETGLTVEALTLKGDIYELTRKKAEEFKSALIIIGLDTHVRFRRLLGSTNITKFLANAPCPVITIRSTENRDGCKNIVMPFDLSPESREKVSFAVQLAHYYKADIRIVSVFHPNDDKYENKLLPYLQQVKRFIKEEGVNCTNKSIPSTKVAETIVEYADKNDCDLIIQMNQRDLTIGEMFSGTVGQKIVEISHIPVMTINPMKRESMSHFGSGM